MLKILLFFYHFLFTWEKLVIEIKSASAKGWKYFMCIYYFDWKKPWCIADNTEFQKQPPEVFCKKRGLQIYLKRLWHRCFLENFAKFIRILFLQNTSGWLLLEFWPLHWRRPVKSHGNDSNLGHIFSVLVEGHFHVFKNKNIPNWSNHITIKPYRSVSSESMLNLL